MTVQRTIIAALLIAISYVPAIWAQGNKPKFKFAPTGLIVFDGALVTPHNAGLADGVAIPEIRLGGRATYGNWLARIDVGYSFGSLSMKDVYIQYKFDEHNLLRGGYFVHQFGLQSATSSAMKHSFEAPISDMYVKAHGRNVGFMYIRDKGDFFTTASLIVGTKLTEPANESGKVSVGGISRLVWRPYHSQGAVAQVGVSGWYQSAFHEAVIEGDGKPGITGGYFDFSASYPMRVNQVNLLSTYIDNAKGVFKLTPELLLSKWRFALESQYYYMNVNRERGDAFISNGVYALFRGLILGDKTYGYNSGDGCLATPAPKTLECVLGYNYTNANDNRAGIYGGITNDYSVTFNYYINKYMIARLRWSYTDVRGATAIPDNHANIIEARLQFRF